MNKIFTNEIKYIKNDRLKEALIYYIANLPAYFFKIAASSTGKYHPAYALGDGGLVRHTKAVVRIGHELLTNNSIGHSFTEDEKDLLLIAMLLHDGFKLGLTESKYTCFDHPLISAKFVMDNYHNTSLTKEEAELIANSISAHMGEWNVDSFTKMELPKPSNKYQRMVHMCDYLASKKFLEISFDEFNNIIL